MFDNLLMLYVPLESELLAFANYDPERFAAASRIRQAVLKRGRRNPERMTVQ